MESIFYVTLAVFVLYWAIRRANSIRESYCQDYIKNRKSGLRQKDGQPPAPNPSPFRTKPKMHPTSISEDENNRKPPSKPVIKRSEPKYGH